MKLKYALTHPQLPESFKGDFVVLRKGVVQLHDPDCVEAKAKASSVLPEKFKLVGCALCQTSRAAITFDAAFSSFVGNWKKIKGVVASRDLNYYHSAPKLAAARRENDPVWAKSAPSWVGAPALYGEWHLDELREFFIILWNEVAPEVFSSDPFQVPAAAATELMLAEDWVFEYSAPEVIISGTPLREVVPERDDSVFQLIRTTKEARYLVSARIDEVSGRFRNPRIFWGKWDESLLSGEFPEMLPLALSLLCNDSTLSINDAVLSAKLVASPDAS